MELIQEENCLFCNIASKKVKTKVVYEDDYVLAILDKFPANSGHILLLTRHHFRNFSEVPDFIAGHSFKIAQAICKLMYVALKVEGINVYVADGKIAGQKAEHFMIHIIPRFKDDNLAFEWKPKEAGDQEIDMIYNELKKRPIVLDKPLTSVKAEAKTEEKKEVKEAEEEIMEEKKNYLLEQLKRMP